MRLARQPSLVAEDIRAALASLGKGTAVAGGIALAGVRPLPTGRVADAVVVLPRGVLIVLGVDLPDPAMKLEAPLTGAWKADGWPLVAQDKTVNPAAAKLAFADSITQRLRAKMPETMPVGTVLAVGPFVDEVDQPPADMAGHVRVVFPTAKSMLAASVSLASARKPCTVEHARALIKSLAPEAPELSEETLTGEGFGVAPPEEDPLSAVTIKMPPVRPAPPAPPKLPPIEVTTPMPRVTDAAPVPPPSRKPARTVRWLPMAAIGLLGILLVTAIVLATTGGDEPEASPPTPQYVNGIQLLERDSGSGTDCAAHAIGDVQASLQKTPCVTMRRGSFEATVDGKPAAVSVSVLSFPDSASAAAVKKVADEPGGGRMSDLATETGKWQRTPSFDGAAYFSTAGGTTVVLVLASWFDDASVSVDPGLVRAAQAGATARIP
ncbi:hypothetical protein [Amycolatopsis acidicola]|uniref:hypothetical protein n=1 Tax=Amycolatopsis acidicola TaxID=2596893 RepID=UPI00312C8F2B